MSGLSWKGPCLPMLYSTMHSCAGYLVPGESPSASQSAVRTEAPRSGGHRSFTEATLSSAGLVREISRTWASCPASCPLKRIS
eukprot:8349046-Pyramimonas_sp.AAC.1